MKKTPKPKTTPVIPTSVEPPLPEQRVIILFKSGQVVDEECTDPKVPKNIGDAFENYANHPTEFSRVQTFELYFWNQNSRTTRKHLSVDFAEVSAVRYVEIQG